MVSHAADSRRPSDSPRQRYLIVAAAVLLSAALAASAVFWTTGGRWFVVRTPSMGTAAPVGTLVLTRPTPVEQLRVGEIIAFHPPTEPAVTYTHRIVSINAGGVRTRGDINGISDPWTLHSHDLIGRATVVVPALGWFFRALPLFLVGGLLVWGLTRTWLRPEWRGPARLIGSTLVFLIAAIRLRPFVGVVQIASTTSPGGRSQVSLVSTGLLPVRVVPAPRQGTARPVDLSSGETGVSSIHGHAEHGQYLLATHIHLHWTQWALMGLLCAAPLLWTLIVGYHEPAAARPEPRHRPRPALVPA